ncbi:MAG: LacI family transcriptional regulator [Clostridia bacterium]|nr:LacI family transcriptional regulator [Clostridia bacterium]NCC43801.1 LacI family transcriptional regulator [Clostridia bacterium]
MTLFYRLGEYIMMRKMKMLMVCLVTGALLAGCAQKSTESANTDEVSETEPTEEVTAEPTQEAEESEAAQGENAGETEENKEDAADPEEEKEIEIPNEEDLVADYTSVNGLILEKGSHIAIVVKNTETGYWKAVKLGVDQAINDLNTSLGYTGDDKIKCTFEGPKSETDVDNQVNILDAVIAENPAVLCLSAIDMDSCEAQLEAAEENGIPVIILDSGVGNNDMITTTCATDNVAAGREAARKLCEQIGDEGEVAVMAHSELSENSKERVQGFKEEIEKNHPDVKVVKISYEPVKDTDPSIEEQMTEVLELHPELKGYFCSNEIMSVAALDILADYQDRDIQMVGFDLGDTQADAIRDGSEAGVICQNPYGMGYATVVAGVRAALEMENEEFIDAGYQWIDKENIDLEENAKFLYE